MPPEFEITKEGDHRIVASREGPLGITLSRTIELKDDYRIEVTDAFQNTGDRDVILPKQVLQLGRMTSPPVNKQMVGIAGLGVDTLLVGGKGVKHWGKKIPGWFKKRGGHTVEKELEDHSDWLALKSRFFVQILRPDGEVEGAKILAHRDPDSGQVIEVTASGIFDEVALEPHFPFVRDLEYYVGPMKLSALQAGGYHKEEVMELGWCAPVGRVLLNILNFLYDKIWPHNYGLAIMLLTLIIRGRVFWPLTHKGTENMKKLAELQPLMQEIREKYKDNVQKQQQKMMALYREHKVNPVAGCMPMLVQIPVFIALFYVLRSAIELRYASFLWIQDLSQPENIFDFGFTIPLLNWHSLNIFPFIMAATMYWQQKLTPSAGDARQQQIQQTMMKFMPVMMLVILYNFPSGLCLYWATQNILMIVQMTLQKRRRESAAAAPVHA